MVLATMVVEPEPAEDAEGEGVGVGVRYTSGVIRCVPVLWFWTPYAEVLITRGGRVDVCAYSYV